MVSTPLGGLQTIGPGMLPSAEGLLACEGLVNGCAVTLQEASEAYDVMEKEKSMM